MVLAEQGEALRDCGLGILFALELQRDVAAVSRLSSVSLFSWRAVRVISKLLAPSLTKSSSTLRATPWNSLSLAVFIQLPVFLLLICVRNKRVYRSQVYERSDENNVYALGHSFGPNTMS